MQVHTFTAESAADAVAQIRAQLGPQALVLNVRPLPAEGLSRLWQKRRIEVLACVPDASPANPGAVGDPLAVLRQEVSEIWPKLQGGQPISSSAELPSFPNISPLSVPMQDAERMDTPTLTGLARPGDWRVGAFLETSGFLPVHAARIVEELRGLHGDMPPVSLGRELEMAATLLRRLWHRTAPTRQMNTGAHVLIGAPGVGKTVCLCKWLAQTVLVEGRRAAIWRLDGRTANTAETLSVYGEILGIPVERTFSPESDLTAAELLLIDLPGVSAGDAGAIAQVGQQIQKLGQPNIHLVLNAAYELPLLQAQVRAFSALPIADLIFTHLDEETRWGKLWNFVLGTNFSIRFLSAGQNIPGDWAEATAEQILARHFPRK